MNLTPPEEKPNANESVCENCGSIVDESYIREDENGDLCCTECWQRCEFCGRHYIHLARDPYFDVCHECKQDEDYKMELADRVIGEALRYYFDNTMSVYERKIIEVAQYLGYNGLAIEMKNDITGCHPVK